MDFSQLVSADTIKLTVIPGIIVLVVLFFWFRRSGPKVPTARQREMQRSRYYQNENYDDTVADGDVSFSASREWDEHVDDPLMQVEEGVGPARVVQTEEDPWAETMRSASRNTQVPGVVADAERTLQPEDDVLLAPVDEKALDETEADDAGREALKDGLMLVLNVVSEGQPMRGSKVLKAIMATGLTYGKMGIFHYYAPNRPTNRPLFSVANMMEPGSFNLANIEELSTPGLTLFAHVTRPEDGLTSFNIMLETAKKLASLLDATVCDERRGTLSKQGIEHIHGQISEHQRRSRLVHAAHA